MNKNLYRLVFNQARGLLMVVAEIARRSHGQAGSGEGSGAGQRPGPALRMRLLSVSTALALGSSWLSLPAGAEVIADPNAPANQRPTIINAGNGVPVVNIQTPSAAGVSRNTYSQFDVNPQGVVLNNSRAPVQTQQAGWVDANPWLANGTARIILNEVNSNQPSLLRGFIEVGGSRAQVIVANPAGITCDGCGFINANRATLTTGIPQWSGGDISGYRVENGLIRIEGAGLNNRNVDYTDLLSRAIVLNAGLWGQDVRAITGSNQISADLSQITPVAGTGSAPTFSLDVAQLGGMYAGKIRLIGTEAGVGVRNAGTLQASVGQFVVTTEGKLESRGSLTAQGTLDVSARLGVDHQGSGTMGSAAAMTLTTDGTLVNTARITGKQLQLQAASVQNAGTLAAEGSLDLVARQGLTNQNAGVISAGGNVQLKTDTTVNNAGSLSGNQVLLQAAQLRNTGALVAQNALQITTPQALDNLGGSISSNGELQLSTDNSLNNSGRITGQHVGLQANQLQNTGTLAAQNRLQVAVKQALDNLGSGIVSSAGELVLKTDATLRNTARISANQLLVQAKQLQNSGEVSAHDWLQITAGQGLDNQSTGVISAGGDVLLKTDITLNNAGGLSGKQLLLQAAQLHNSGTVVAQDALQITTPQALDNLGGSISSSGHVLLSTDTTLNNTARISGKYVRLQARQLENSGSMAAETTLQVTLRQALNNLGSGVLSSGGDLLLSTDTRLNNSARISGKQLQLQADQLQNRGNLTAQDSLSVTARNGLDNQGSGLISSAGDIYLKTDVTLNNTARISGNQLLLQADGLHNSGTLSTQGVLSVTATQDIVNQGAGVISSAGQVYLKTDATLDNTARIYGGGVAVQADRLLNHADAGQAGVIAAHEQLDIGVRELRNQDHALLLSEQDLRVGRTLDAQDHASGQAELLSNHSATLEAARDMTLKARQIDNVNDHIMVQMGAVTQATIDEYQLDGSPNRYQLSQVSIGRNDPNEDVLYLYAPDGASDSWNQYSYTRTSQSTEIVSSDPGRMLAGGKLTIETDTLNNDNSRIMAGGDLLVTANTIINKDTPGTRSISDSGTATHYYRIQDKGHDSQGRSDTAYTPPSTIQSITMGAAVYQGNLGLTAISAAGSGGAVVSNGQYHVDNSQYQVNNGQYLASNTLLPVNSPQVTPISAPLPVNNALFQFNPAPTARVLIETDERFTNYRQWLSSDFMLERLRLSPENMHKRLGDGFYEQRLVREQVAQLTGRRFLDGYANDEAQYRALLEQGATYAQQWQLRPGVALSAEQMARLTSDMVWLVEQRITLADGSQQTVWVPQLYLRPRQGELNAQGGLMSGLNVRLNVSGDIISSGQISGRQALALNAENVRLLGGKLDGAAVNIRTRSDLELQGGRILGEQSVDLQAGRDLIANSSTRTQSNAQGSRTNIDRVAGIYVSNAQGNLNAHANRNLTLNATEVANTGTLPTAGEMEGPAAGRIRLSAGQQLTLGTVTEQASHSIVWNGDNWRKDASSQQVGSQIHSQGDIQLIAGTDLTAHAATVSSDAGAIQVQATGNVNILAGEQTRALDEGHKVKGSNGLLSRKTTTTRSTLSETTAVGSTFSGDTVQIQAGQDVHIQGSQVGSTYGTEITAGHNLIIDAASNEQTQTTFKDVQKSGLFGTGGIGFTIGKQQQTNDTLTTTTTATGSLIGSTEGDVVLRAGQRYQQVGSDVVTGSGDIQIEGKQVSITEASESRHSEQNSKFKQSGLTVTLSNPVLSAAQTVSQMSKASKQTSDPRMQALAAITAGAAIYNAVDAVQQNPGQAGGISISISIGSSKNESHSVEDQRNSRGSTVKSGGDLSIVARGAGQQSDLTVQGSQLKAAGDLTLSAEHDLNLLAARNSSDSHTTSSGKSGSIGIAFSLGGEKNGFSINAGGSKSKGQSNGNDVTWVNTQVEAGKQLTLKAGQDTNLIGAQAKGQRIVSQTGGNLTITSLQDSSDYHSQNSSNSFGVSLCIPPICAGASSVSASTSRSKLNSTWQSVTQQSGLLAGDGGFDVQVGQHTQLNGAVIASTDAAVRQQRNQLSTATLSVTNLHNHAEYSGSQSSFGISYSGEAHDKQGNPVDRQGKPLQDPNGPGYQSGWNGFSAAPPMVMNAKGQAESTTYGGISSARVTIRDNSAQQARTGQDSLTTLATLNTNVSSERDGSNRLGTILNEQQINANYNIVSAFGQEVSTFLSNRAKESAEAQKALDEERRKDPQQQNPERIAQLQQTLDNNAKWQPGGNGQLLLTAVSGAFSSNVTGSGGDLLRGATINYLQGLGAREVKQIADQLDSEVARTALHGLLACAGAAAQNQSCGSAALGASSSVVINNLLDSLSGKDSSTLTAEQKKAREDVVSNLIGGITQAAGGDAAIATLAGRLEMENNAFTIKTRDFAAEMRRCSALSGANYDTCATTAINHAKEQSKKQQPLLVKACFSKEASATACSNQLVALKYGSFFLAQVTGAYVKSEKSAHAIQEIIDFQDTYEKSAQLAYNKLADKAFSNQDLLNYAIAETTMQTQGPENLVFVGGTGGGFHAETRPSKITTGERQSNTHESGGNPAEPPIPPKPQPNEDVSKPANNIPDPAASKDNVNYGGDHVVHFAAGTKNNWNAELNKPRSNTTYNVDGNIFKTDSLGRTVFVEVSELKLAPSDRNAYQQKVAGRTDRLSTDVGGHLLGAQFGGPGEGINIVAMDGKLNGNSKIYGQIGQLEKKWADNVRAGNTVSVTIRPVYEGTSLRPSKFDITETINGTTKKIRLTNQPGG